MLKKIITSCFIIALAQFSFAEDVAKKDDKIIAKINGKAIYESEVKEKITRYAGMNALGENDNFNYDTLGKDVKDEIIKRIIFGEMILTEAQKLKLNESVEYKQALDLAGKQLLQKMYLDKVIKENITEAKLQEKYKQMAAEQANKEEYKASHILVKTEDEAKDIKKKLDKGGDFSALAKEFSLDSNKDDSGSLGYFSKGQMVAAFEEATAALKVGEISGPVKTDFGYHIIKLEDKRKAKAPEFEQIRSKLYDDLAAQFLEDYLAKLKIQNKVELF